MLSPYQQFQQPVFTALFLAAAMPLWGDRFRLVTNGGMWRENRLNWLLLSKRFPVAQPTVQIGAFTRTSLVIGGLILIIGGLNDLVDIHKARQSNSFSNISTLPAVITIAGFNSQGGMKLGLGVAILGASGIGVDVFNRIGQKIDKYEASLGLPAKEDLA